MLFLFTAFLATVAALPSLPQRSGSVRVKTYVHSEISLNMVSSLIIGSEAAVIVDLPLTISSAKSLASWIKNETDKPVVAAFTTHIHPDHYLSASAFLDIFPEAKYYSSEESREGLEIVAQKTSNYWTALFGEAEVVQNVTIPEVYAASFFTLPGDVDEPIHLIKPVTGDTFGETLFWIPSISTLISGDAVYGNEIHVFVSDMLTKALTASWVSTLDFLVGLKPAVVIPGHALTNSFIGTKDLTHTRDYVKFYQSEIEAKGTDFYTPQALYQLIDKKFPGRHSPTAEQIINVTAENFGKGGKRFEHFIDFTQYNDQKALEKWHL